MPDWLAHLGTAAWLWLGVIGLAVALYFGLAQLSALLVPLVVAVVIGMIFHPAVQRLAAWGIKPALGATMVLVSLVAAAALALVLSVKGVADQGALIAEQMQSGWLLVQDWLAGHGVSLESWQRLWSSVSGGAGGGLGGVIQAGFSSAAAFALGLFVGTFLLFYLLKDWGMIRDWLAGNLGLPLDLGSGLIEDATTAIRRYFYGLAVTSVPVAAVVGVAMWALGLPLAFTVALVTFLTAFIPYLGAILSGVFTVLVALGAGGLVDGAIMLAVVLLTQNVLQTVILTKITSDQLALHPIVNLGSTIIGATLAGLVGATLSAPIVAMLIAARARVAEYYRDSEPAQSQDSARLSTSTSAESATSAGATPSDG